MMKALIKENEETVTEDMGIVGIDWNTGMPLTHPCRCGGPYTLVQNYVPPKDEEPAQYEEVVVEDPEPIPQEEEVVEDDDYVTINGIRYTKEELRRLIE